jgi:C-terminal processing protease CtpA/Prc
MMLRGGARENYGFVKVERLPGNVGYIDMRQFYPAEAGKTTAIATMNFVANCDALIFDMRQNGGGEPSMIQLISSYLFDKRTHLNDLYWREGNRTEEFWTHEKVEGMRMANTPVYVLTSRRTFSGAEEFTNNLKMLKRAKIIGETTGGGANPGDTFPVGLGLVAFIPTGRAVNPISHSNWEGTGVEPDEKMPAAQAFDAAYSQALQTVEQKTKDPEAKTEAAWIRSGLELRSKSAPPSTAELQRYAGKYGDRTVTFENGALYSQRGPGPKTRLVPLNSDTFSFEGMDMARLQFTPEGQTTKAIINYADGRKEEATRE